MSRREVVKSLQSRKRQQPGPLNWHRGFLWNSNLSVTFHLSKRVKQATYCFLVNYGVLGMISNEKLLLLESSMKMVLKWDFKNKNEALKENIHVPRSLVLRLSDWINEA